MTWCRPRLVAVVGVAWWGLAGLPPSRGAEPALEAQAIVAPEPSRFQPRDAGSDLVDYDLSAAVEASARARAAGQPWNFDCVLLKEFIDAYHPGSEFTWQRPSKGRFRYVGTRKPDDTTLQQVYVNWQPWSDSIEWNFNETEITRHLGVDPFEIIPDAGARAQIRNAVGPDSADRPCDAFLQRTREIFTEHKPSNVSFPAAPLANDRYGVFVDGQVRFFSLTGDPL